MKKDIPTYRFNSFEMTSFFPICRKSFLFSFVSTLRFFKTFCGCYLFYIVSFKPANTTEGDAILF